MIKDKILIELLTIKAGGGEKNEVKEYIIKLLNSIPGSIDEKNRRATAAISAYGSYERGLFDEEFLADMLWRIIEPEINKINKERKGEKMKGIVLLAAVMLITSACTSPFVFKFPENINDTGSDRRTDEPRPEWVDKNYWEENGFAYAVGKAEKNQAGSSDIQLRYAVTEAKRKFLEFSDACSATIVGGTLLKSWTDSEGTVYALMRADKVVPWASCGNPEKDSEKIPKERR